MTDSGFFYPRLSSKKTHHGELIYVSQAAYECEPFPVRPVPLWSATHHNILCTDTEYHCIQYDSRNYSIPMLGTAL